MYLQNKYTTWYYNIINRAKQRISLDGYKENHHIIPRSLGGSDSKDNLVSLTAREHFICHLLLTKMLGSISNEKLVYAAWLMANQENNQQTRYKVNSRIYQMLRQQFANRHSKLMSESNPMHDPLVREKHAAAIQKRGKTKGNTGNKQGPISDQLREVLRQKTKESMTPERIESIRQQQLNRTQEQKEKYAFAHSKRISCIFCKQQLAPGNFTRWHGDNCKLK